jgi:hypothetical protein
MIRFLWKPNVKAVIHLLIVISAFSCRNDAKDGRPDAVQIDFSIERFDKELFSLNADSLAGEIPVLYEKYDDFLDIFSYHIIRIGSPASIDYAANLKMFLTDPLNLTVYDSTCNVFPNLEPYESQFRDAFRRYKFHFHDAEVPRVVSYISRFNHSVFTVGNYIGIGLDRYLGAGCRYYDLIGLPEYMQQTMAPEYLVPEALATWARDRFPYNDSVDNVLAHLVHEGKLLYFVSTLLPETPMYQILGFSEQQMSWCRKNEDQMWVYLVENKLVFSQDPMDIQKLTGPSPFTSFFSVESPGRAAVWNGYQIFAAYAKRNPELSLPGLMKADNYQEILRLSRYNP